MTTIEVDGIEHLRILALAKQTAKRERSRVWYAANRDKERERRKAWRIANPDKSNEYTKTWRAANPDKYRESLKNYRTTNRDKLRERHKAWHAANRDKHREDNKVWRAANYFYNRARSLKKRRETTVTAADLAALWEQQGGICALWGISMTLEVGKGRLATAMSVDRLDNSKPYTPNNIRLVCNQANMMRGTMTDEELIERCKAVLMAIGNKERLAKLEQQL